MTAASSPRSATRAEPWEDRRLARLVRIVAPACAAVALFTGTARAASVPAAGRTSQHAGAYGSQRLPSNAVSFTLRHGRVARFSIPWVAACTTEAGEQRTRSLLDRILIIDALPVRKGRFVAEGSYAFPPGPDQKADVLFTLRGVVRGRRVSGTLELTASITLNRSFPSDHCATSRNIRWNAVTGHLARNLAAPARRRLRTFFAGNVAYARTDPGGGPTAIFRTTADRSRRTRQVTQPPAGAVDGAPALPDIPGFLAYRRTVNGVGQIHLADPIGSFEFSTPFPGGRDTDFPQGADDPAVELRDWRIAFSVGRGADCAIWVMGQYGDDLRRLTDHGGGPGCDDAPTWSPDGKRLAFRRTATDAAGDPRSIRVLVVRAAGGTPRPIKFGDTIPFSFSWAPGRKIAYVAAVDETNIRYLAVVNPDGTGRRTLWRSPRLEGRPVWAQLRDRIAVVVRRADASTDIAAVPAAGGAPTDITKTPGISEDSPTWSFPLPPDVGGGEPGPSVHVKSQSTRPHGRRRKRS
jgi:hypothetical protein